MYERLSAEGLAVFSLPMLGVAEVYALGFVPPWEFSEPRGAQIGYHGCNVPVPTIAVLQIGALYCKTRALREKQVL